MPSHTFNGYSIRLNDHFHSSECNKFYYYLTDHSKMLNGVDCFGFVSIEIVKPKCASETEIKIMMEWLWYHYVRLIICMEINFHLFEKLKQTIRFVERNDCNCDCIIYSSMDAQCVCGLFVHVAKTICTYIATLSVCFNWIYWKYRTTARQHTFLQSMKQIGRNVYIF